MQSSHGPRGGVYGLGFEQCLNRLGFRVYGLGFEQCLNRLCVVCVGAFVSAHTQTYSTLVLSQICFAIASMPSTLSLIRVCRLLSWPTTRMGGIHTSGRSRFTARDPTLEGICPQNPTPEALDHETWFRSRFTACDPTLEGITIEPRTLNPRTIEPQNPRP